MIDQQTIARIIDAADIVDVVSQYVTLRRAGTGYRGLCPFHDDTTPSFSVSPQRNICKCFACGEGGNPVNFIMKIEQKTYPEALRFLAKRYNIEVPEREMTDTEREEEKKREATLIVNEWADGYFSKIMNEHPDGMAIGKQYFISRGFREDIIKKFHLGFALDSRDAMSKEAIKQGYKEEFLVASGIIGKSERDGRLYDRFAGRVIFPWLGLGGKVVAFGGRKLDAATKGVQQKYINSPESDVFHKENELYGIYQARAAMAKLDLVYMVEGYTDVISMHQCGIENVVANSGTALSHHQVKKLCRFTKNIVMLYDGDSAGIKAAMRGINIALEAGMDVRVLLLPDGDDPDSFAKKMSAEEFRKYIAEHQENFIEFKARLLVQNETDPNKRNEGISSMVNSIAVVKDSVLRDQYIKQCSIITGVRESLLIKSINEQILYNIEEKKKEAEREVARQRMDDFSGPESTTQDFKSSIKLPSSRNINYFQPEESHLQKVERMIAEYVVRYGNMIIYRDCQTEDGSTIDLNLAMAVKMNLQSDDLSLSSPLYQRIVDEGFNHSADENFSSADFFSQFPDPEVSDFASSAIMGEVHLAKSLKPLDHEETIRTEIEHLLLDLRRYFVEKNIKEITSRISDKSLSMDKLRELMTELKSMQTILHELNKQLRR